MYVCFVKLTLNRMYNLNTLLYCAAYKIIQKIAQLRTPFTPQPDHLGIKTFEKGMASASTFNFLAQIVRGLV